MTDRAGTPTDISVPIAAPAGSATPGAGIPSSSNRWGRFATIFVVALLLRGACLLYYGPTLTNDSYHYLTVAQNLLDGRGLGLPYRSTPGYAVFLAGVLRVAPSHWAIVWTQAVLGALTCVVLAAACDRLFRARVAFCLGLGVALYIPLAAFCAMVLRETLIAFAVSVTTYCLVRSLRERRQRWHWATGVACGATFFCQPTFLVFPLWAGLAHWIDSRSLRQAFRAVAPVGVCLVVVVGVWTARNYAVTSRFIPVTADHVGYFLLQGIMDANVPNRKSLTPKQIRYLRVRNDDPYNRYASMRDRYWEGGLTGGLDRKLEDGPVLFGRAVRLIRRWPGRYLVFSAQRLHHLWFKDLWVEQPEPGSLSLRPLDRLRERGSPGARALSTLIYGFGYASVLGVGVFGKRALGLVAPIISVLSFHMWMHAETRYALAIHPHLLIFSMLATVYLWQRLVRRGSLRAIEAGIFK